MSASEMFLLEEGTRESIDQISLSLPRDVMAEQQKMEAQLSYYFATLRKVAGVEIPPQEEEEEEEEGVGDPLFLCPICFTEKAPNLLIKFSCEHTYCRKCMQEFVYQFVQQGQVCDLKCPDPSCDSDPWTISEISEIFEKPSGLTFRDGEGKMLSRDKMVARYKYFRMLADVGVADKKDVRKCPFVDCEGMIFLREGLMCRMCGREPCGECFCLHKDENETCKAATKRTKKELYMKSDKYKRRKKMRIAAKAFLPTVVTRLSLLIQPNVKRCPGCDRYIYKYYGCPHMYCPSCHTSFCWICLSCDPYSDSHCLFQKILWPISLVFATAFSAVYAPVMFLPWLTMFAIENGVKTNHKRSTQIWHNFYFINERIAMCPF